MTPMRGLVLTVLLLVAPASAGDITFAEEPCRVPALEFEIGTPEGWERLQNHRNLVVRSRDQTGFIVSREPFLHDPKRFGPAWEAELRAAGKKVKVTPTKVGRLEACRTQWTAVANGDFDLANRLAGGTNGQTLRGQLAVIHGLDAVVR